ncbi:unnamed protein product [Dicrocoelium dendriticum]|nr:unnamed protein product [Dicrocoelium dendriticum]
MNLLDYSTYVSCGNSFSKPLSIGFIVCLPRFRSESEAIDLANATNHGLAAYIYTQQIQQAWSVARQLQCGMVGINSPRVSAAEMPFGGVKDSGIGREG